MRSTYDILIIDDEQVIIDAVIRICSTEQLKVDAALDGATALKKVKNNSYRLIICDIMLPGMDGFEFLEQLKPLDISTAFIMTTGYSTNENAVKSLCQGAIDFLPKPFTTDEFCSTVKRGFKYVEIHQEKAIKKSPDTGNIPLYEPCPATYFKLGYGSWLALENTGSVMVGVTDLFLKTIDSVDSISLLANEQEIIQGNQCAMIRCKDGGQNGVISPVTGRIIEKNKKIEGEISIMEKDPFSNGWLYRVIPSDLNYQMKYLIPGSLEEL